MRNLYPQTQIIAGLHSITSERIGNPELKAAIKCVHEYNKKSEEEIHMSKNELREVRKGMRSAAGNAEVELAELERVQKAGKKPDSDLGTITVGCSTLFSIICC